MKKPQGEKYNVKFNTFEQNKFRRDNWPKFDEKNKLHNIQSFYQDADYPKFQSKPLNFNKMQNEIIDEVMRKDIHDRRVINIKQIK